MDSAVKMSMCSKMAEGRIASAREAMEGTFYQFVHSFPA